MTLNERLTLIDKCRENTRSHKPNADERRKLVHETCRQIIEECELADLINRTAWTIETSIDELVKAHSEAPAYVERNYEQLHRAYSLLSSLVSAIQPQKLEAAE